MTHHYNDYDAPPTRKDKDADTDHLPVRRWCPQCGGQFITYDRTVFVCPDCKPIKK